MLLPERVEGRALLEDAPELDVDALDVGLLRRAVRVSEKNTFTPRGTSFVELWTGSGLCISIITGSLNSGPLSGRTTAKSLLNSFGPAGSQSMLKMRVVVCDVFESLRKASASLLFGKHIVYSTLPEMEPTTVSTSVGVTPGCAWSQAWSSFMVRPTRHFAFVLVSGFLCGLRREQANGSMERPAPANSPSLIHPYTVESA